MHTGANYEFGLQFHKTLLVKRQNKVDGKDGSDSKCEPIIFKSVQILMSFSKLHSQSDDTIRVSGV